MQALLVRVISAVTLVFILMQIFYPGFVTGIQCWKCNSREDPGCGDPFENNTYYKVDCDKQDDRKHLPGVKATMCRKIRQKVNGNWRVIRDCARVGEPGIGGDERFCLHTMGTFDIYAEVCTCARKDGCNGASRPAAAAAVAALAALTVALAGAR
ncbi:uncharacterized protein LOC119091156 [Pollicipes pollicipes]|uniref:uncharacterized protein LOC119091156 n=1 Tax=Pollicipes pollicipes TaxID=41117 RepID=UPI0018855A01|nr:uncharacterized protein LOC119091156 [Pollicipes pollicipes]